MILGLGTASTDETIIAEFHQLLEKSNHLLSSKVVRRVRKSPYELCKRLQKPIMQWSDEEILALYEGRSKVERTSYNSFVSFLLFRGYHRPGLAFLMALPAELSCQWTPTVLPYRQKIEQTTREFGYIAGGKNKERLGNGNVLTILIWMLIRSGKSLHEVTRSDFNAFRDEYQHLSRQRRKSGLPDGRLYRLEKYLVHWGVLPAEKRVYRHEERFAKIFHHEQVNTKLQNPPVQTAILLHLKWCEVRLPSSSSMHSRRAALITFFLWFQEHSPLCHRLDDVSRSVALSYAEFLKQQVEAGRYGKHYHNELYNNMRLFFDFVIEEQLETAPPRNPFSQRDVPRRPDMLPRYLTDHELQAILAYCEHEATLFERTVVITMLHTGIRAMECAQLKATDIVQVGGKWKLHVHEGKGLKDRVIPLTPHCLAVLQQWQKQGWERINDSLFTRYGVPWKTSCRISSTVHDLGLKVGVTGLTAHRFRHSFAVALLNYGIRESALQKLMGHSTLEMTLEYARILDETVERSFTDAIEQMQDGPHSWVPNFFVQEEFTLFAEGDSLSWIQLPVGFCRRNPKLHCESDIKCLLCERFHATPKDLPRFQQMQERFTSLGLKLKADVVAAQIQRLEANPTDAHGTSQFIPTNAITVAVKRH